MIVDVKAVDQANTYQRLLLRATLALCLVLTQSQAIAHGFDHLPSDDNPVCATCVAGQTLTAADHDSWALLLPLAQRFRDSCLPQRAFPSTPTQTQQARAPPPTR